jgi:hypothetical protein
MNKVSPIGTEPQQDPSCLQQCSKQTWTESRGSAEHLNALLQVLEEGVGHFGLGGLG